MTESFLPDVEECLKVLHQGGVILYPTDTVWGLGCDACNPEAVAKIFAIKQRAEAKSLLVLLADERELMQYVTAPDPAVFDYLMQTSKPTTVIYEGVINMADNVIAEDGSVGIRLVQDTFCRHLVKRLRKPLVSTSANISGQPTPANFTTISSAIKEAVDYVVQYRQDDPRPAQPSSIIRWKNGMADIIRP